MDQAHAFVLTVEKGSFSAAARHLGTAPSSVVRQVNQLEATLGVQLLRRTTRSLTLTEAGERYYAKMCPILEQVRSLHASLSEDPGSEGATVSGRLRVTAFESFGRAAVLPAVAHVLAGHPAARFEVSLDNALRPLSADAADVYVRIGRPADSAFRARALLQVSVRPYASPSYLERAGTPHEPRHLEQHNCLTYLRPGGTRWHFARASKSISVRVRGNLGSAGGTPLAHAAEAGVGIALLTPWLLRPAVDLVPLLPRWSAHLSSRGDARVHVLYHASLARSALLRAFVQALAAEASRYAPPRRQ